MKNILDTHPFYKFLKEDTNGRFINIYKLENISTIGDGFYPNVLFKKYENTNIYNPYKEKIMSLQNLDSLEINNNVSELNKKINIPLFFFIYNTDNYYHFVYDTLPYLISYFELKKTITNLKLLMSYPNSQRKEFYKFVKEFLEILGINEDDIILVDKKTLYTEVYFSNSYTHDIDSNLPPRGEVYDFFKMIVNIANSSLNNNLPKKIYISRRSWIHGDVSNMGTNYTNRRKLVCEDELVDFLKKEGFEEIFTENLSTIHKIQLFNNAEYVIGAIGGGLCNVLFSNPNCKLISICSPYFLEINNRFKYSFNNVNTYYFEDTYNIETNFWKKWMRIKYKNIVGEIEHVNDDETLTVLYVDSKVAGWNSQMKYKRIDINQKECLALDNGLNSSWNFNMLSFKKFYEKI